jgi:hypothetical protein
VRGKRRGTHRHVACPSGRGQFHRRGSAVSLLLISTGSASCHQAALPTTVLLRTKFSSPMFRVSPDLLLEDQSDCPLGPTKAYIGWLQLVRMRGRMQRKMDESTNENWAPTPPGFRQRRSLRCSSSLTQLAGSRPRPTSPDSSKARKEVRKKAFRTWFWVGAFVIIVPFGFAIWPLRKLYLMLKERFDERWEKTVL